MNEKDSLIEDAPTKNAGSGHVAGIGVGKDGEPGYKKKKKIIQFSKFKYAKGDETGESSSV